MSTLAPKGPTWVTLRQYRRTLWLATGAVALTLVVIGGARLWDELTPDTLLADGTPFPANDSGYSLLRGAMHSLSDAVFAVPFAVALFVAGPMLAREYESGTYRLSLTQSVTPTAWLRGKLGFATATALGAVVLLTGAYALGWVRVGDSYGFLRHDAGPYLVLGTVLAAYTLLAVAVGALAGLLIHRTLVAMSAAGLATGTVMLALAAVRWDFLTPVTITGKAVEDASTLMVPDGGRLVDQGLVLADGRREPGWFCAPDGPQGACRPDGTVTAQYLDYHPVSHVLPTQLIETGIVLTAAALALFAAFRVLRARHP
ncbi:ABC transporter permease [Streptomyces sp. NPDC093105]|uniref:ABC transporter permease n=1 Tax=Streptomyces sp. NPDC093105 TaxID=3366029 RepID=UPI003801DC61